VGEGFGENAGSHFTRRARRRARRRILREAHCWKAKEVTNEQTMSWTDERVEQLRQHWIEGKSASQIAILLGHGLTRNAVIGKVHRLGLAGRAKPTTSVAPRPRAPSSQQGVHRAAAPRNAAIAPRVVRGATALAIASRTEIEAEPEAFESVVLPMSIRVTILELKEAMCRWPLGDPSSPDFRYCGSTVASGPYCAYHGRLAYQPAQDRRRERDRQQRLLLRRPVG
jgi:GcrA cell cycle regulator